MLLWPQFTQIREDHNSFNHCIVRPGNSGWSDTRLHGCALSPQLAGPGSGARRPGLNRADSSDRAYLRGCRLSYAVQRRGALFPSGAAWGHRPADDARQ